MVKHILLSIILVGLFNNQVSASEQMTIRQKIQSLTNSTMMTFALTGGITLIPVSYLLKDNALTQEEAVPVLAGWAFATGVGVSTNACSQLLGNLLKWFKLPSIGNWLVGFKKRGSNYPEQGNSYRIGTLVGILTFAKCTLY